MNAPQEYYDLEERYSKERDIEEKERILKRMLVVLPKHKGTDREFASLKRRLSLLRKEAGRKHQVHKTASIRKKWPRMCLLGYETAAVTKMFNLTRLGAALYGMVKVDGIPVQLVVINKADKNRELIEQSEIVVTKSRNPNIEVVQMEATKPDLSAARRIAGIIGVYTEDSEDLMAMKKGDSVYDLARKLHVDVQKNSYAVVYGSAVKFQGQRVGLNYRLADGDRVFIKI